MGFFLVYYCMEKDQVVKLKDTKEYAIIIYPPQTFQFNFNFYEDLTLVMLENGSLRACSSDNIEEPCAEEPEE